MKEEKVEEEEEQRIGWWHESGLGLCQMTLVTGHETATMMVPGILPPSHHRHPLFSLSVPYAEVSRRDATLRRKLAEVVGHARTKGVP